LPLRLSHGDSSAVRKTKVVAYEETRTPRQAVDLQSSFGVILGAALGFGHCPRDAVAIGPAGPLTFNSENL
jgi:hypothetical protein